MKRHDFQPHSSFSTEGSLGEGSDRKTNRCKSWRIKRATNCVCVGPFRGGVTEEGGFHTVQGTMFVCNGVVTPGPSCECDITFCDITFFVKGRPKAESPAVPRVKVPSLKQCLLLSQFCVAFLRPFPEGESLAFFSWNSCYFCRISKMNPRFPPQGNEMAGCSTSEQP